jgi:cell division protein FtsW
VAYRAGSDRTLLVVTSVMTIFGLLMVYNASAVMASTKLGSSSYYFLRQLGFAAFGYLFMILLMNVDYHVWQKPKVLAILLVLSVAGLLVVFTQPKINGAQRWLRGPMSFQPSEVAKLVLLMFLAAYLHRHASEINQFSRRLVPCMAVVLTFVGLIAIEPDLGQAICIVAMTVVLLFVSGLSWLYLGSAALLAAPAFYFFVYRVPFRWGRLMAFLDPGMDPLGAGWQITQSLTAIGSGGLFGTGLGGSKQKLFFLPYAHSDFIFAIIGEEIGLVGTLLVTALFLVFFYRGMKISLKAADKFGFYLALGITSMVTVQSLINISMVLSLLPTKGIALPFISQGGSSMLLNLMATGVLLNISQNSEASPAESV